MGGRTYYQVFALEVAFAAMIGVTAVTIAIAVGRDSQRIALLALIGGFVTPLLVSTGTDAQIALFGYVAVLNASLLAVAWKKSWRWLELPALVFNALDGNQTIRFRPAVRGTCACAFCTATRCCPCGAYE